MPHNRRYSSSDRESRSSYQDRYRDRGRRHRHRRSHTHSSSSDRERDRRGRGHRQEGSYLRSRRYWMLWCKVVISLFRCLNNVFLHCFGVAAAMTIARQNIVRLIEGTTRDTGDWIRVESETGTGTGSLMERLKAITRATSPQTCTTTDVAARENATSRTGGKAAGVSTNEGGVEPGPIALLPRWVDPGPRLFFNSSSSSCSCSLSSSSFFQLFLSLSFFVTTFFFTARGLGKYYIFDLFLSCQCFYSFGLNFFFF